MKPTYEPRTYASRSRSASSLSRHPFSRSPSHSRRTRLRLAIITAPDIYRHGIRARRLISGSRLSLAPPFSFRLFLPFFSFPFLFPTFGARVRRVRSGLFLFLSSRFSYPALYEVNRAYASLRAPRGTGEARGSAQIQTNCAISGSW